MHTSPKILNKVKEMVNDYYALAFVSVAELPVEIMETREHLRCPPTGGPWKPAERGMSWGGHWMTAWFRTRFKPSVKLSGQPLFLRANTGGHESLAWVDNEPRAILTAFSDTQNLRPFGHTEMLITPSAGRKAVDIAVEAYAWHPMVGTQPRDDKNSACKHTFNFMDIATRRDDVWGLVFDLRVIISVMASLDENSLRRNTIIKGLADVFAILPQLPGVYQEGTGKVSEWSLHP